MICCIILLLLIPLTFEECPTKPDPKVYQDPRWQLAFYIYKKNFNKTYHDKEEEKCHITILVERIDKTIDHTIHMFLGDGKGLDVS